MTFLPAFLSAMALLLTAMVFESASDDTSFEILAAGLAAAASSALLPPLGTAVS